MSVRPLVLTIGAVLLPLALLVAAATLGGTPVEVQAAQNTPTRTVQPANTPVGTATPRTTATPRAGVTGTPVTTQQATPTTTLETGPVITLTTTAELDTQRTITVVGTGRVDAQPDQAQATIGVETSGTAVQEAVEENNQRMEAVIDALLDQGIDRRNIQTTGFNIFTETPPPGPEFQPTEEVTPTTRFRVIQQVGVTITDIDAVGDVLNAAIDAGANNIFGVNFMISDTEALRSRARRLAMEDALRSAQELAQLANVELGGVVSVSEVIGGPGPIPAGAALEGLGGGAPIEPGQLTFRQQIQVTFSIR